MVDGVVQRDLGSERPADDPGRGKTLCANELERRVEVFPFINTMPELTFGCPAGRRHAAEIESKNGDLREFGKSQCGFTEDVRIHVTTGRRQRVEKYDGSDGVAGLGKAEFANKQATIRSPEFDIAPTRGKFSHRSNLAH
jgi:hypothetical protein